MGVVRRPIALEDARAGGALAALDADQVLEGDRDAEERMQGGNRGRALVLAAASSRIGRVGLGQGRFPIDRQPCVQGVVLALGRVEMGERKVSRS